MTQDLDLLDVVDADVIDDRCAESGSAYCPGDSTGLRWMPDPYDGDVNDTTRFVYLHPDCAAQRAADI